MVTEPLYNPCGGDLALDFLNSTGRTREGTENERLVDYGAFLSWSEEAGTLSPDHRRALVRRAQADPRAAQAVLERAIELRESLFPVFFADLEGKEPPPDGLEVLNAELARALPHAVITADGEGYRWAWDQGSDALDAPLWPLARAAADLLVSPDRARIKECASDCSWLFVDRTRNRRRRWCEMKSCGNREKVREHRRRKRAGS